MFSRLALPSSNCPAAKPRRAASGRSRSTTRTRKATPEKNSIFRKPQTPLTLQELIAQGESNRLEFKSTVDSAVKIAKTLVAFANTGGGTLLIGVTDSQKICGIASEGDEMGKIEEASDVHCQPPLPVSYTVESVGDKKVLLIIIPESDNKPHTVQEPDGKQTIYVRMADKTVPTGKLTGKKLTPPATEPDKKLLQSAHVKSVLKYLKANDNITPKRFAKLLNISERRATKLLMDLVNGDVLLPVTQPGGTVYALK